MKLNSKRGEYFQFLRKSFFVMRITLYFILLSSAFAFSSNSYAQDAKLSLQMNNAAVKEVLKAIEDQSEFIFFYQDQQIDLNRKVNIVVEGKRVQEILDQLFVGTTNVYMIKDRQITIGRSQKLLANKDLSTESLTTEEQQQKREISGSVKDAKGLVLPGVTVYVKGTSEGTVTDMDGKFRLPVTNNAKTLVFSFVGMKTQEITLTGKETFTVTMEEASVGLDEVVAIGYGSMRRKDLTGSVGSVKMTDLEKAPVPSFDQALAGRVAGVQVTSNDGQPGAAINIVIRGNNSVTQNNSPLYVVDGFPIENNDNNAINPSDIESIDILKDASATAIYGARGANGVIMITTKRGKVGAPIVKYDGYYGFEYDTKKIPLLSPYEFVKLQLEINSVQATANYLTGGKSLDSYKDEKGIDWYDRIMQKGQMKTHNVSVSGGTDKSKYSASVSMVDQDGTVRYSGFKRYQGRVTLDQTISEKVKFGLSANYSDARNYGTIINNNQNSVTGALMYSVWTFRPLDLPSVGIDPDELFDPLTDRSSSQVNPLVQIKNEVRQLVTLNLFANSYAEYLITKDLKLRVTGGMSNVKATSISFNNSNTRTGSPNYPLTLGVNGSQVTNENVNFSNENTLTYAKLFGKDHSLNIVGGYSNQTAKSSAFGAAAIQIPNESLGISGMDEGSPNSITSLTSSWTLQSFYARLFYGYKSRYLINATMRTDGSSKFSPKNRWGYFPSLGIVYKIGQEEFLIRNKFISDAKIRVSYGATGNNRVGDFSYLSSVTFPYGNDYSFGNAVPSVAGAVSALSNPDLKWETTKQFNTGLDLSFLKGRLSFTGDYYNKRTDDLLLNADIPSSTGYTTAYKNIGSVSNSGFEFTLNSINWQSPEFKWNSNFNISFNRNKIISLTDGQESILSTTGSGVYAAIAEYIAKVNHPIALFYGTISDGLYSYDDFNKLTNGTYVLKDEIPSNGSPRNTIQPGYAKYKDLNGDGLINSNDYTIIGNPNPIFTGGFSNNFEYKGFDLNVFFQFSYGNDIMNANRILFEGGDNYSNNLNMYATYANRWSPTNTNTDIPNRAGRGPQYWSTHYVEDGSFLRLKTVALPGNILEHLKMKSVRIYISAQNLYTWTRYSGLDPEVSVRNTALTPGLDYSAYPRAKTITFGVNASF